MGQRFISIHPTRLEGITTRKTIRKRVVTFGISIIQRMRDIPNDRFGDAYINDLSCSNLLEDIIPIIESIDFFVTFKEELDKIIIPPSQVSGSYDPQDPPAGLPSRYQLTEAGFKYLSTNLDPIHLYPSDFLTRAGNDKEQLYDKVAGFRFTSVYESPAYQDTIQKLHCNNEYETTEAEETSSSS